MKTAVVRDCCGRNTAVKAAGRDARGLFCGGYLNVYEASTWKKRPRAVYNGAKPTCSY